MESVNENENELFQYDSRSVLLRSILLGQFDDCRWSFYGSKKLFSLLCISSSFVTLTGAENLKFKFFHKKKTLEKRESSG